MWLRSGFFADDGGYHVLWSVVHATSYQFTATTFTNPQALIPAHLDWHGGEDPLDLASLLGNCA